MHTWGEARGPSTHQEIQAWRGVKFGLRGEMREDDERGVTDSHLNEGPPPPVRVRGLLGTGPHGRRGAVGEGAKLRLYLRPLPIAPHCSYSHRNRLPRPCQWKNCLPSKQSSVPKRLGTADLND